MVVRLESGGNQEGADCGEVGCNNQEEWSAADGDITEQKERISTLANVARVQFLYDQTVKLTGEAGVSRRSLLLIGLLVV